MSQHLRKPFNLYNPVNVRGAQGRQIVTCTRRVVLEIKEIYFINLSPPPSSSCVAGAGAHHGDQQFGQGARSVHSEVVPASKRLLRVWRRTQYDTLAALFVCND